MHQVDLRPWHAEDAGKKLDQLLIGATVERRGGDTQFQPVTMKPDNLVAPRARLNLKVDD
jgi:hypothetical protein